MTMPAEVTSDATWDRLTVTLRAQYADIDELYQSITDPDADIAEPHPSEGIESMADPGTFPKSPLDDSELRSFVAGMITGILEVREGERVRGDADADADADGRLDGDYDIDPADEPDMDA